jgi:hypothetical protein
MLRRFYNLYGQEACIAIVLFIAPFFIPTFNLSGSIDILVTAVSTLFAIVVGFFIADAMANYLRLQTLIAEENGTLISLAHAAREINPQDFVSLHNAIDAYLVAQLNHETLNHILQTEGEMRSIVRETDSLIQGSSKDSRWDATHTMLKTIHIVRQEIALVAKRNLTIAHWVIVSILGLLLMLVILAVRDGSIFFNLVASLMIVGSYAILVLLNEVDSNRLLEQKLSYENPYEIFLTIDKTPYYPWFSPPYVRKPGRDGTYRLGKKGVVGINSFSIEKVN